MKTTIQKYNKLCDMELVQKSRYDINDRISLIVQEVQAFVKKCEEEARALYDDEKKVEKSF